MAESDQELRRSGSVAGSGLNSVLQHLRTGRSAYRHQRVSNSLHRCGAARCPSRRISPRAMRDVSQSHFLNHVNIALGSLAELETCLVIAMRLEVHHRRTVSYEEQRRPRSIGQMLHGLASSLERRIQQQRLGLSLGVTCWFLRDGCSLLTLMFLLMQQCLAILSTSRPAPAPSPQPRVPSPEPRVPSPESRVASQGRIITTPSDDVPSQVEP